MPPLPSDVVSTCQSPEALVMSLKCRTAPSDSVTVSGIADTDLPRRNRDGRVTKHVDQIRGR